MANAFFKALLCFCAAVAIHLLFSFIAPDEYARNVGPPGLFGLLLLFLLFALVEHQKKDEDEDEEEDDDSR